METARIHKSRTRDDVTACNVAGGAATPRLYTFRGRVRLVRRFLGRARLSPRYRPTIYTYERLLIRFPRVRHGGAVRARDGNGGFKVFPIGDSEPGELSAASLRRDARLLLRPCIHRYVLMSSDNPL